VIIYGLYLSLRHGVAAVVRRQLSALKRFQNLI